MISVGVHVAFKSGKIMHLNIFHIDLTHKKNSSQKRTRWANFNKNYTKACVSDNCIVLFVFLFSVK